MRNNIKLYLVCFYILFNSCDTMDSQKLIIYNGTQDTLLCFWSPDNQYKFQNNPLNGLMKIKDNDTIWRPSNSLIFPHTNSKFSDYNWQTTISNSKTKKLYIFCYKLSTIRNDWNKVKDSGMVDSTIILSYKELEKVKWTVEIK